jgi:hypothetical protein
MPECCFQRQLPDPHMKGRKRGEHFHRLVPAVKAATGVERVYHLALMERAAQFHHWLIPKKDEGDLRGLEKLAQKPPLTSSRSAAEAMAEKIRAELQSS